MNKPIKYFTELLAGFTVSVLAYVVNYIGVQLILLLATDFTASS